MSTIGASESATRFTGIHHVTFAVKELGANIAWYETCLQAKRVTRFDHHNEAGDLFAVILELPGLASMVELRIDPTHAVGAAGYRPVAFSVRDRAELDRWVLHLDSHGIEHTPVTKRRIAESIDMESPDGLMIGFYTDPVGGFATVEYVEAPPTTTH